MHFLVVSINFLVVCFNVFAFFGSGNLTTRAIYKNLELGMIIFSRGNGKNLVEELYQWGSFTIRSMSKKVKSIPTNN